MICSACGKPVHDGERNTMFVEVIGWTRRRAQGGANQITFRRETGKVAHGRCISAQRQGISPNQESLL